MTPPSADRGTAASFDGATGWLNSEPLTPEGLRGRVVLVDFWTYTCVNWLRTLPYVRAWDAKYRSQGLTVVGVHTPEFGFEHDVDNVIAQSRAFGVEYPIAIDSDYGVWRAFGNHFWPAIYLADAQGRIRYHHFGEGEYAMTEMAIQQLLLDAGAADVDPGLVSVDPPASRSRPTTGRCVRPRRTSATARRPVRVAGWRCARTSRTTTPRRRAGPQRVGADRNVDDRRARGRAAEPGGRIAFRFQARDVNLVMGPAQGAEAIPFRVCWTADRPTPLTDPTLTPTADGRVTEQRTYQLIRQPEPIESAPSRSSSSTPASRRTASPSAERRHEGDLRPGTGLPFSVAEERTGAS